MNQVKNPCESCELRQECNESDIEVDCKGFKELKSKEKTNEQK